MTVLLLRALPVWVVILGLAIANGAFREVVLIPRIGVAAGHVVSVLMLSTLVLAVTVAAIRWIRPVRIADVWAVGGFWLALTVAFEFLAGHFVFGQPWPALLADYRIDHGRIWPVVLAATFFAPALATRLRLR
jgi:hypothetical protein